MALNLNNLVDKAYESKSFKELLDSPPSALEGLTTRHDEILAELGIKSVADLGKWKYAERAAAIRTLASFES